MKVIYDPEKDILQIAFAQATVYETTQMLPGLVLDYDEEGQMIGLELRKASHRIENPQSITYEIGDANMEKPQPKVTD